MLRTLRIRYDEIYGFIRIYDGTRYLTLFGPEKYDVIYNRIRYLMSQKSGITYAFSHYIVKIKLILVVLYQQKKDWLWIML